MRALLVRFIFIVLSRLSLPMAHRIGHWLGSCLSLFANSLRDTARTNIQRCFPRWTPQQQQQLVLRSSQETLKAAMESAALWMRPPQLIFSLIRSVKGEDVLREALAKEKGVILLAPHLGGWEITGLYTASTQRTMTSLYRPPRQTFMGDLIRQSRERTGAKLVPTDASGVRALYKALGRGELIGILPDQDPDKASGVFAPFFGVQANTMTLLSRLARKSGATVLIAYADRLPKGEGYHVHFVSTDVGLADVDMEKAAASLNKAIEGCVMQHPEQYLWAYKRFKTRPEGEGKFY